MKIIIGSRRSRLAMAQTNWVAEEIRRCNPGVEVVVKEIVTKGDRIQHLPLDQIGGKGLFTEEIERELLSGEIDLAVHSMKDMPGESAEGLAFAVVPKREDRRDVIVLREGIASFQQLPKGARIGCGSKRRSVQLLAMRPDLSILPIRGNIETRIAKIASEGMDGIILAAAGLHRLSLERLIGGYFSPSEMIPACAQGALALQVKADRKELMEALAPLRDPVAEIEVAAERAFLAASGGGCHLPVGACCDVQGDEIVLTGLLGSEEDGRAVTGSAQGPAKEAGRIGAQLAARLRQMLSDENKQA